MTHTRQRVNQRALTIAHLITTDAPLIQAAIDHLRAEEDEIAIWPTATIGDGTAHSSDATQPERGVLRIELIRERRRQLSEMLNALDGNRDDIRQFCHQILADRADAPAPHPTCEADPLLPGYYETLTQGGWHDPTCKRPARSKKGGLCDPCRKRLDKHLEQRGLKALKDERPIEHDSRIWIDDQGVAHTRPLEAS